jgi:hypothetical protein
MMRRSSELRVRTLGPHRIKNEDRPFVTGRGDHDSDQHWRGKAHILLDHSTIK